MQARLCHALTLLGYLGIMALLIVWYGWLAPPQVFSAPVVILTLGLPLFLVLRGLLHARPRAVAWSLFLSLFYFTHGIVEAYSNSQARWLALTDGDGAGIMVAGEPLIHFSALHFTIEDLVAAGVIDPKKVVRVSISSWLSSDCIRTCTACVGFDMRWFPFLDEPSAPSRLTFSPETR